ncbi:hypothetical protein AB8P51_06515 [Muriicola sp. SD30]|uniref:hypothetical protein n=1 Tax=Muriicola sp. SD30 TaxID=3240936 RepID=UPI0035109563
MSRLLVLIFLISISCSSSNDPFESDRWVLDSTYSYMTQTEQQASEMDYTEKLEFVSNGLFLKSLTRDGDTTVVEGRWVISEEGGRSGYLVTYSEDHDFVRNCFAEPQEFFFEADGMLIQSDFTPCDGPEFRYVRSSD